MNSEVKLWDVATRKTIADLKGHQRWVECVRFSARGKTLVTVGGVASEPGEIKLWDLDTLPKTEKPQSHPF
jgi:WD40 repeat protein